MATDYAEREREFLAGLEADTGHDLAGWMRLIEDQKLAHRNDIIDWLRTKGFHFSWASWLERIHHNGGRPIYVGAPPPATGLTGAPASTAVPAAPVPTAKPPPAAQLPEIKLPPIAAPTPHPSPPAVPKNFGGPTAPPPPAKPASAPPPALSDLSELLAKAKAYRMLAEHLIREIRRVIPGISITAVDGYVSLRHPAEFAVLAISPKELRLGLDLGEDAGESVVPRGRMTGTAAAISHVGILTDARQVNPGLLEVLRQADSHVNRAQR